MEGLTHLVIMSMMTICFVLIMRNMAITFVKDIHVQTEERSKATKAFIESMHDISQALHENNSDIKKIDDKSNSILNIVSKIKLEKTKSAL